MDLVERYLSALTANDPSQLATSSQVRFTENGQQLSIGKGLWATATPGSRLVVSVSDAKAHQVGAFAVVNEADRPVLLALRLGEFGGVIEEIETIVCRGGSPIFAPDALAWPSVDSGAEEFAPLSSRSELVEIASLYFEGILRADGDMIPVSGDCRRVENGVPTALNPDFEGRSPLFVMGVAEAISTGAFQQVIEAVRERRYLAVDVASGLVYVGFVFDHPGPVPGRQSDTFRVPSSMMCAEIFKISGGLIRHIEAIVAPGLPYGIRSGW